MTRRRRKILIIALSVVLVIAGTAGWFVHRALFVASHIPEAYAAWDTGTMLVEYMKAHDDRWPGSWPDLLTVLDSKSGRHIQLHGASGDEVKYAKSLGYSVAIDWHFDPTHPGSEHPVTRLDGTAFPVMWEDPNEMVHEYLQQRPATQQASER